MLKTALEKHMAVTDKSDETQGKKRNELQRDSKESAKK